MWPTLLQAASSFAAKPSGGPQAGGASGYGQANTSAAEGHAYVSSPFDSSNWTVATGSARASATNASGGAPMPASVGGVPTSYLLIGAIVLVALKFAK